MNRAQLPSGIATGIGSLPHRDAAAAAEFVLATLALPAIPTLPKRSPAEGMIPQALVGLAGITVGQYGSIAFDANSFDPEAPVVTDLHHDAFGGWRAFLAAAAGRTAAGEVAVRRARHARVSLSSAPGSAPMWPSRCRFAPCAVAFANSSTTWRTTLPGCRQVVFIDEPKLDELMGAGFPIPPDTAVDLVSAALAAIEPVAVTGLHVLRHRRHRLAGGHRARCALGAGRPAAARVGRVPGTVPQRRRHHRLGCGLHRGADRHLGGAAVAQVVATCGASSFIAAPTRRSCASNRSSRPSAASAPTPQRSPSASTG